MPNDFHPIAQIACEFRFEASHQLRRNDWSDGENDAVFGNCARLHGHSYRLEVSVRGPIRHAAGWMHARDENPVPCFAQKVRHAGEVAGNLPAAHLEMVKTKEAVHEYDRRAQLGDSR